MFERYVTAVIICIFIQIIGGGGYLLWKKRQYRNIYSNYNTATYMEVVKVTVLFLTVLTIMFALILGAIVAVLANL